MNTILSDLEKLEKIANGKFLYAQGRGWFYWDGRRWSYDPEGFAIERFARTVASSGDYSRIKSLVRLCSSHPNITCDMSGMDRNAWTFGVQNGAIDLKTGELIPYDCCDQITKTSPVLYDPKASCPVFTRFLREIFDGHAETMHYVIRLLGYCLTGDVREQILPVFIGDGANGKSTLVDCVSSIMGDYSGRAPEGMLAGGKKREYQLALASLHGTRLVIAGEQKLKAKVVKSLIEDEVITGRFMRQDSFNYQRTQKIIIVANSRPEVDDRSNPVWDKLKLVPFPVSIPPEKRDNRLLEKLEFESSGILNLLVRGCRDWLKGGLRRPKCLD